jgi:MoxR-like ATPase
MNENTEILKKVLLKTKQEVAKVIIGYEQVVDQALIAIFTGTHALIEGVPGIAKTLLVRTLAHVMQCDFARFSLVKGPVFCSFLLADEINRAPAKTQSALLQAMQERTVTIDRETHPLPANFTVFATQNPIEYEGTYPLPEAQKDRFMLKISMDPPGKEEELTLARRMLGKDTPEDTLASGAVQQIIKPEVLPKLRAALEGILVKEDLVSYVVDIVRKTRNHH